jgi:hypothetical protein
MLAHATPPKARPFDIELALVQLAICGADDFRITPDSAFCI